MFTCTGRRFSAPTGSGKRTDFCLVRHGCTAWNLESKCQGRHDLPLTEKGREQATAVAAFLRNSRWEAVVASDLLRAKETAEIIGRRLQLPVLLYSSLRERDFGLLEGLTTEEIRATFPDWFPEKDLDLPGVEPLPALAERAKTALNTLAAIFSGHRVVVVSHGAFLRAFFVSCLQWDRPAPGNGDAVEVIWEEGVWKRGEMVGEE
ncbi:MAG TPA: histidine phosphatase family protein [Firmicutes bacterium]|jgi:broad specificity phosphatase PhoE|nr:histidine phosphatase family protein [Bacillota bacterium]